MSLLHWIPIEKLNFKKLSRNFNPNAICLLEKNQDKIDWELLSFNFNAISLLEKNIDKIYWYNLMLNYNSIHLIQQYYEQNELSSNWSYNELSSKWSSFFTSWNRNKICGIHL